MFFNQPRIALVCSQHWKSDFQPTHSQGTRPALPTLRLFPGKRDGKTMRLTSPNVDIFMLHFQRFFQQQYHPDSDAINSY
jgi:hypothetical protein